MLRKKDTFTVITPIPSFIPRQLAIDILHSHSEVITLNPLVLSHKPIAAPQNAETDEYYSTWYEITERIQVLPGIGKMGASTIKFNGCFHNMPWGLQTHIYAPMNVDLRNTYRIAGNQPGVEPPEPAEIGLKALGAPSDGLYLREDIEIRCNVTMLNFVKSQLKRAGAEMVRRIIKKAELLDAGVLQAMIEDGKLKTLNPADRSQSVRSPLPSPTNLHYAPSVRGSPPIGSPPTPYQVPRIQSMYAPPPGYYRPGTAGSQQGGAYHPQAPAFGFGAPDGPQELPAAEANQDPVEMPGDFYHAAPSLQPGRQSPQQAGHSPPLPGNRDSVIDPRQHPNTSPNPSVSGQWTTPVPRPVSISSNLGSRSPGLDSGAFPAPLAPHRETKEEHQHERQADAKHTSQPTQYVQYNPADYAKAPPGQAQYGHGQLGQRYNYAQ
ncbi:d34577d1-9a04-4fc1-a2e2-d320e163a90b [Thermothielavioides terrestris]|jgi:hypothetical protein|uniref:DUF7053 domain-containing protein n=2 Tax=Thermothielavioides terrestris TaxID=2587410 RepID=G2R0J3_THETT|nr:uncharacterized protein THITE_2114567 [Thermothielavioides terrestris NRRL 8126]AEO66461.1 hypothetical protein THITE_2114567 [Thermothielavioides terrestris NRRL 8126]SPQ20308.1 d34577d1-9a04-4fc1-a2e2-d320e163a90b [Thermothielavioides terrestris]